MSSYGSDSDSDAPEEVSLQTAKQSTRKRAREQLDVELQAKKERREKNKAKDKRLKESASKRKRATAVEEEPAADDFEDAAQQADYLDPAVFESTAELYAPSTSTQSAPGQGKKAIRREIKAKKQQKRIELEQQARLAPGSSKQIGDKVLQHLPDQQLNPLAGMPTVHPKASSTSKFINNRLYSDKKRAIAVLDASKGPPPLEKKRKGKMSDESKRLLGLLDPKDEAEEERKEKKRKKTLLLQSEGLRKRASLARPLRLDRGRKPATEFAISGYAGKTRR